MELKRFLPEEIEDHAHALSCALAGGGPNQETDKMQDKLETMLAGYPDHYRAEIRRRSLPTVLEKFQPSKVFG